MSAHEGSAWQDRLEYERKLGYDRTLGGKTAEEVQAGPALVEKFAAFAGINDPASSQARRISTEPSKGDAQKGVNFGIALAAVKSGVKISRQGWNGKGMYVVYQKGYPEGIEINANTAAAIGQPQGTVCKFSPYLMMRAADGSFVPWLASQTDILAEDWTISG